MMNWTLLAFAALAAGPGLIWYARRHYPEAVYEADKMPELAMWGYFLMLVGAWGSFSLVANPSDLFFAIMLLPAVLALAATLKGYQRRKNSRPLPDWAAFGFGNALVLAIIGLTKTFMVEPMQIPTSSMRPGLEPGDFILVNKFSYGLRLPFLNEPIIAGSGPQRGDVVVLRYPRDTKINYIKRMIGLPGDTVAYRNKQLTVNGQPYASIALDTYGYKADEGGQKRLANRMEETMAGKRYSTLNEPLLPTLSLASVYDYPNRDACQYDDDGFICKVPAGHYWVMGDNRDDSSDSRYWGFVAENQMVGRAMVIWMNWGGIGSWPELGRIWSRIS